MTTTTSELNSVLTSGSDLGSDSRRSDTSPTKRKAGHQKPTNKLGQLPEANIR